MENMQTQRHILLQKRTQMFQSYLEFFAKAQKSKKLDGIEKIQLNFFMFGTKDEIDLISNIVVEVAKKKKMTEQAYKGLIELNNIALSTIREELGLEKIEV